MTNELYTLDDLKNIKISNIRITDPGKYVDNFYKFGFSNKQYKAPYTEFHVRNKNGTMFNVERTHDYKYYIIVPDPITGKTNFTSSIERCVELLKKGYCDRVETNSNGEINLMYFIDRKIGEIIRERHMKILEQTVLADVFYVIGDNRVFSPSTGIMIPTNTPLFQTMFGEDYGLKETVDISKMINIYRNRFNDIVQNKLDMSDREITQFERCMYSIYLEKKSVNIGVTKILVFY